MKLDRNSKIIIAGLVVLSLVILGLYLNNRKHMPKYSWNTNYVYSNDQPYGTNILYSLLGTYSDDNLELIEKENVRDFLLKKDTSEKATYFVIGNHCNYEYNDLSAIKSFVREGNTAFLALEELPYELLEELHRSCSYEWYSYTNYYNLSINANFTDEKLKTKKPYKYYYENLGEKKWTSWSYFGDDFCEEGLNYEILGRLRNDEPNFIRFKVGKGQIYLHSNPMFFSNLHMIRPQSLEYLEKALSYLPEGPIYWDRNSKIWSITNDYESNTEETPFAYILKQRSFKWAFYTIWIGVIVFVLFNLWRKQKEIPVKFPKSNSTLEFIHTIGELYFSQKNHKQLAIQKMDLFVKSVRTKYHISEKEEEKFIDLLAKKSTIPKKNIKRIFAKYEIIKKTNSELPAVDLIEFYKELESFNKLSK